MSMLTETLKYSTAATWDGCLTLDPNVTDEMYAQIEKRLDTGIEGFFAQTYQPTIVGANEVVMKGGEVRVRLLPNGVGCNCRDMSVRRLPCKHTIIAAIVLGENDPMFADVRAAAVAGDDEADSIVHTEEVCAKVRRSGKSKERRAQDVRVGDYFLLSDFLFSNVAAKHGVPNFPESLDGDEVRGIMGLCEAILDPVVEQFGPLSITNAFQSEDLWFAKHGEKGSTNDLHSYRLRRGGIGGAADILVHRQESPEQVIRWIKENCEFDRLILYPDRSIICVAWTSIKPRRHCKTWQNSKYVNFK